MFKYFDKPCSNCLLSKDAIVSPERVNQIVKDCVQDQDYFICHKASIEGDNVCCSKFFKAYKGNIRLYRFALATNKVQEVSIEGYSKDSTEGFIPYREFGEGNS